MVSQHICCVIEELHKLKTEIFKLLKLKKINTTANHSQIDDLVEQFNHIITNILYKKYYGVIKTVMYN